MSERISLNASSGQMVEINIMQNNISYVNNNNDYNQVTGMHMLTFFDSFGVFFAHSSLHVNSYTSPTLAISNKPYSREYA